jgi:integrase
LFKTKPIQPTTENTAKIINVIAQMESKGKAKDTIKSVTKALMFLARNCNLNHPEQVTNFIAKHNVSNGTKEAYSYAYRKYCKYHKIDAEIPFYQPEAKPIKLPTKEKLLIFITNASKRLATKLKLSMETGLRPIELHNLKVKDVDLEQRLVYPTTAKHGAPRTLKISMQLATMLQERIIKKQLNQKDIIFLNTTEQYGKNFRCLRNRLSKKLHDPTLKNIRLYDFRHYFCTKKLYDTRNTFIVMNQMGHKKTRNHTKVYAPTEPHRG